MPIILYNVLSSRFSPVSTPRGTRAPFQMIMLYFFRNRVDPYRLLTKFLGCTLRDVSFAVQNILQVSSPYIINALNVLILQRIALFSDMWNDISKLQHDMHIYTQQDNKPSKYSIEYNDLIFSWKLDIIIYPYKRLLYYQIRKWEKHGSMGIRL